MGPRAVAGLGVGSSTRANLSYFKLKQDSIPEYGLPWVPVNTNPDLEEYADGAPPVDQSNFYGLTTRDYEKTDTDSVTAEVEHDLNKGTSLRNLTRWGQNVRDSVITAPRFAAVNTSTDINRQLQSRDMTDRILANQTNLTTRFPTGRVQHAVVAGLELSTEFSENYARTGPAAPIADLFDPNPFDPYPGLIVRTGARTTGSADSVAAYAFDTVNLGAHLELTGGLRLGSLCGRLRIGGHYWRSDAVRANRYDDERTRWHHLQAASGRQHLSRLRDVVQPVGGRAVAQRGQCRSGTREVDELRGRHEVGPLRAATLGHGGSVPDGQDQRPHARRECRRSADRAGGPAERRGLRGWHLGPDPPLVDGDRQLRQHA